MSTTSGRSRDGLWLGVVVALFAATPQAWCPVAAQGATAAEDPALAARAGARPPDLVLPSEPGAGFALELLWERTVGFKGPVLLSGTAADLDGDGRHELLLHGGRRNDPSGVAVLDGESGDVLWRAAFPHRSCAVAADLTGDGAAEVVVACGDELSVLDGSTGERVRGTALRAAIGDLACARVRGRPGDEGGPERTGVRVCRRGHRLHRGEEA